MKEEEKSWRDARSNVRTGLGLGFEIAANSGLDIFSFIPGSQQAGSAFINYLAQKIRGGEVSKGEILAAAATSQIPGLTQAKALTKAGRFYRSVAKGSIAGGITTTSMSLVDEKELPSFGEFAGGVGLGGAFGGMFDLAPGLVTGKLGEEVADINFDTKTYLSALKNKISTGTDDALGALTRAMIPDNSMFKQGGSVIIPPPNNNNIGSKFAQQTIEGMSDKELAPYTLKFRPQPWEKSPENLLEQSTGIPQKLEQPLPYGQKYTLIPDKERGRPLRQIVKEDIDLSSPKFRIGKDPIDKVVRNFRRRIVALMQIDRIRSEDVGTKVGFNRTSTNINKYTEGTSEISNTYFDYLTGYFNRFIRPGKVRNFDGAVNLIAPKVGFPDQITTVKGNPALLRELRLFTIAPDVYGSGAFKTSDKTYQSKLKSIIRRISLADEEGDFKLWDKRSQTFKYKVDAHHIDQIDEGWPLYEGLPKEEIPKMRKLVQAYGLQPGNHEDNALLLIKQDHVKYHAKYWPIARQELETTGEGWPTLNEAARLKLLRIKTAIGREDYVKRYVKVVMESQDKVTQDINIRQDLLAAKKNKTIAELTSEDIKNIDIEIDQIDPSDPLDRSVKAPKDIQKDIDEG